MSSNVSVNKQYQSNQQLFETCELCSLCLGNNELLRPFCTNKCLYCNKNVCAHCAASAAEVPFKSNHSLHNNEQNIKQYICLQCIVADRHKNIIRSIYKAIGNHININIINIIALFSIEECINCNKTYPKSWTIIQPDVMSKIVNNFTPKCMHIRSVLWNDNINNSKYEIKYCKACNIRQEKDVICNAIYNILLNLEDDFEILSICDIIASYSTGRILSCSNFNNCHNDIIIDNNFDGLIQRKDINGKTITRSDTLDRIFCYQCTFEQNRCDRITEKCSFCYKYCAFGHNITCNGCLKRFCDECVDPERNYKYCELQLEKKYYFTSDGNMKYYQYCKQCTYWIYDDIDLMDDEISSISHIYDIYDTYQELINDIDYTEYHLLDQFYGFINHINAPNTPIFAN